MKVALIAFGVFLPVAVVAGGFWAVVLGPVMEDVWPRLGGAAEIVGPLLLAFAVLSGLGAYAVALSVMLRRALCVAARRAWVLTATVGLLPPLFAAGLLLALLQTVRLGF
jgi:hypothetical protein